MKYTINSFMKPSRYGNLPPRTLNAEHVCSHGYLFMYTPCFILAGCSGTLAEGLIRVVRSASYVREGDLCRVVGMALRRGLLKRFIM